MTLWRLASGLGALTNLNDGYPWGLWITFDVVGGVAMAAGGFTIAGLVYILNKGKYKPIVRAAILNASSATSSPCWPSPSTSASPGSCGRPVCSGAGATPRSSRWRSTSRTYVFVLLIELSPAFFEKSAEERRHGPAVLRREGPRLREEVLPRIVTFGVLLPTCTSPLSARSSCSTGPKLHPLWFTTLLPLLFLISASSWASASWCSRATPPPRPSAAGARP